MKHFVIDCSRLYAFIKSNNCMQLHFLDVGLHFLDCMFIATDALLSSKFCLNID